MLIVVVLQSSSEGDWSGKNASQVLRMLLDPNNYDKRFRPGYEGMDIFQCLKVMLHGAICNDDF